MKLYKGFTELPFDEIIPGEIPQPRKLEALGPIKHVVYISNKWIDSEGRRGSKREWMRYLHDWKHNPPTLCFDKINQAHHIIGKVLVAPEGIKDYRGKGAGNKTDGHTKYDIPKQMTFLGYLDEIVYESVEDDQEYKIEYKDGTALCANPTGLKLFIARMKKRPKK